MNERLQVPLGFLGFGEVGSGVARGLRREGLEKVSAYDGLAFSGRYADLIQRRAQEAGVRLLHSPVDLAKECEVIVGATPGSESVAAAESLLPGLGPDHLYVDLAAATPGVKERVGEILAPTGATLGDGAIMSSPLEDGHRIAILASGAGAEQFRDLLTPWGMRITVVGEKLGAASGIKSLRTVFMKGIEALLVECAMGSARYGILDDVLGSIAQWMDQRPFMKSANFLMSTDAIHAERRAKETDMSVEALKEIGVDPIMTRATAERLHWVANLGLNEHFGGVVPEDFSLVLDAIEGSLADLRG